MAQALILQTAKRPVPFTDSPRLFGWRGSRFSVNLLLCVTVVADHDLTQAIDHSRPICAGVKPPYDLSGCTQQRFISCSGCMSVEFWCVCGSCPRSSSLRDLADGVITMWNLLLAAAGGRL